MLYGCDNVKGVVAYPLFTKPQISLKCMFLIYPHPIYDNWIAFLLPSENERIVFYVIDLERPMVGQSLDIESIKFKSKFQMSPLIPTRMLGQNPRGVNQSFRIKCIMNTTHTMP